MTEQTLEQALAWLDQHINLEVTAGKIEGLSLERMRQLVRAMGDPQQDFPVIHVTGTNGKGSTSAMTSAMLAEMGLTVGTYGSPHVSSLGERIQRNLTPIPPEELAAVLADLEALEPHLADRPSWFELLTAAAFRWFADSAIDVAVVEVGKLGRFDATNVVDAGVAVVTNIGLDHTDGAPGWRRAIAWEKAGIIRPGATLCLGQDDPELNPVYAEESPGHILVRDRDFGVTQNRLAVGGRLVSVRTPEQQLDDVFVSLHGAHQGDNAALAVIAVEAFLGRAVPADVVEAALGTLQIPGRFEVLAREPLVVVDGAHNPDGATVALAAWREGFRVMGQEHLVVGMLNERDPAHMLAALEAPMFARVICCTPPSPRALPAAELARVARSIGVPDVEVVPDPAEAIRDAIGGANTEDGILAAGSLYVAGPIRAAVVS